jgi:hypothetical protein
VSIALDVVARAIAYEQRRALVIRETSQLSPDPEHVFAIAPVKMVSEERVQAVAFGTPGAEPQVVTLWNPLARDAGELEPFAAALDVYLTATAGASALARIWLPHRAALTLIDVLGFRYRTNKEATESLRKMGGHCRALVEESGRATQQVVAVAGDLLSQHTVSGMPPMKDLHLGALLAWVDPAPGSDPLLVAEQEALLPAAGMMLRDDDDLVERLRRDAKRGDGAARAQIEAVLARAARVEWDRLERARRAYWSLGLLVDSRVSALVTESRERLGWAVANDPSPATRPDALSRLLDDTEYAQAVRADLDVRSDRLMRERARRAGRAVRAEVARIDQPTPNRNPCTLFLRTQQEVLRVRHGTVLSNLANSVVGRVMSVTEDGSGAQLIELLLEKGVRRTTLPGPGTELDWVDGQPFDSRFLLGPIYKMLKADPPALAYEEDLPAPLPRELGGVDLIALAGRLRR